MSCCDCCCDGAKFTAVQLRADTAVFSPWIERKGDNLRAMLDVVSVDRTILTIRLFTKRDYGVGSGTEVDMTRTITISSVGRLLQEWGPTTGVGLRTWVRYKFTTTNNPPNPTTSPNIVFRMLSPIWFDTVPTGAVTLPSSSGAPN